MDHLDEHSVNAIITDLPYGTTYAPWDAVIPFEPLWRAYRRVLKNDGVVLLFGSQPFTSMVIASNIQMYKYCWYWVKEKGSNFLSAKQQPMRVVEEICVFHEKKHTYNPQMVPLEKPYRHTLPIKKSDINKVVKSTSSNDGKRQYKEYTHAYPKNTLYFPRDKANKSLVPTQKPIKLLEYLVKTYTNEGDLVLDSAMGSGTTCLACKNLSRNYIGMEIDPKHYQIALERLTSSVPFSSARVSTC